MNPVYKDGYKREVFADCVNWYVVSGIRLHKYTYCVSRFPFVPDYHLCKFVGNFGWNTHTEYPLQTFKTLTEALAVLRVLDASSPEFNDE